MHSRDTTVLIDFQWFNVVHYSSLFQYFFLIYYGPYSSQKFLIFLVHLFANFFLETLLLWLWLKNNTGEDLGEFKGSPFCQWQTFDKLLKFLHRLTKISVLLQKKIYKKTLTFTSFCCHQMPTTKSTPFMVSEDEWETKEGPGKSMKNVLYGLQCAKTHIEG